MVAVFAVLVLERLRRNVPLWMVSAMKILGLNFLRNRKTLSGDSREGEDDSMLGKRTSRNRQNFKGKSPMSGWRNENARTGFLNYRLDEHYSEQEGYAIVNGATIHYWLYDTVTNHKGDASDIYNEVIPKWAENLGFVVDYDNTRVINPNTELATSVRTLMSQRGSDVSVALVTDGSRPYIVINKYSASKNNYKTTIYPLYKR